jgi:hypothetical protein
MANTKKTPKAKKTTTYKPTDVAVVKNEKGKLVLLVGARRIAKHKGTIIDTGKLYWSQLRYAVIATSKDGKAHLSTAREAGSKGWQVG